MGGYRPRVIAPPTRHECSPPSNMGMGSIRNPWRGPNGDQGPERLPFPKRVEHGTLWCCDCGLWWVAGPHPAHGRGIYFAGGGLHWKRVYWFNWLLRARIRKQTEKELY